MNRLIDVLHFHILYRISLRGVIDFLIVIDNRNNANTKEFIKYIKQFHNEIRNKIQKSDLKYKERFNFCFDEETAEELVARGNIQPRARRNVFPAETEEDREERLQNIASVRSSSLPR